LPSASFVSTCNIIVRVCIMAKALEDRVSFDRSVIWRPAGGRADRGIAPDPGQNAFAFSNDGSIGNPFQETDGGVT